jgi:hypothetical protein
VQVAVEGGKAMPEVGKKKGVGRVQVADEGRLERGMRKYWFGLGRNVMAMRGKIFSYFFS